MTESTPNEEMWTGGGRGPRPKLRVPFTKLEIFFEILAAGALIAMASSFILKAGFQSIPPAFVVVLAIYAGFSVLQRFPHVYNYPFGLTIQNAHRQYQLARQLLTLVKSEIVCFYVAQWELAHMMSSRSPVLGIFLILTMICAIACSIVHYVIRASIQKRQG